MDLKQILLILHARAPADTALALAARLAKRWGAMVEGVCMFDEPETSIADDYAIGSAAIGEVLEHRQANVRQITAAHAGAFQAAITAQGRSDGWRVAEAPDCSQALVQRARLADLVVVAQASDIGDLRRLTETLAFSSGAPVLLAPPGRDRPLDVVVVAWNGSRESRRALDESLPFLLGAKQVHVVVVEDGSCQVTDSDGSALLRRLARHGVDATLSRRASGQGHAGRALLAACADVEADLLVLGAYSHSRAAESILGGVTRTVLEHAATPTLMAH